MKRLVAIFFAVGVIASLNHIANEEDPRLSLMTPTANTSSASTVSTVPASQQNATPQIPASQTSNSGPSASVLKDGTFTGQGIDNPYGTVQIAVVISQGKITDVNFLNMPSDMGHSAMLSRMSQPLLKQTTIDKQNANIDFVSGATYTSESYQQSLQSALDQAKA